MSSQQEAFGHVGLLKRRLRLERQDQTGDVHSSLQTFLSLLVGLDGLGSLRIAAGAMSAGTH